MLLKDYQHDKDCGYLSLFYTFRVFLTPELLDMISKLKESLNNKFKTFKEFIQDCFIFAHNKTEEKVRKY